MQNGGKRPGAGRKRGSTGLKTRIIVDVAAQVLKEIDAKAKWVALLNSGDHKVIADVLKYLTNRVHGMPAQTLQGNNEKPLTVTLNWGSKPEWMK